MLTNFKRVSKLAYNDFIRNSGRSLAAIFVLVITIFLFTNMYFFHGVMDHVVMQVKNKIDITAYFKAGTQEEDILAVKDQITQQHPDVRNVEYVSAEKALANFTERHKDDDVFSQALTQVGENPFLPSLNITTNGNPAQYQQVALFLQGEEFNTLIEKVDFSEKEATINKIFAITSDVDRFLIFLAIVLVLVGLLVVFNTIKLAIDNSKDEIATMRIVGASSWFVRLPFVIQGAMFGLVAFAICFLVTIVVSYLVSSRLSGLLSGFSVWNYFLSNIFLIATTQLFAGVLLGVLASVIVVNRYLKV